MFSCIKVRVFFFVPSFLFVSLLRGSSVSMSEVIPGVLRQGCKGMKSRHLHVPAERGWGSADQGHAVARLLPRRILCCRDEPNLASSL